MPGKKSVYKGSKGITEVTVFERTRKRDKLTKYLADGTTYIGESSGIIEDGTGKRFHPDGIVEDGQFNFGKFME